MLALTAQKHERLRRLGRVARQMLGQDLDTTAGKVMVRRPAALLGGPTEKAPLTSRSCSTTVTVPRSRSTRYGAARPAPPSAAHRRRPPGPAPDSAPAPGWRWRPPGRRWRSASPVPRRWLLGECRKG